MLQKMILLLLIAATVFAAEHSHRYVPETDPLVLKKIEEWQDLKFGLLMHWGPYSQWGIVESWSLCSEDEPWCTRQMDNYDEYKRTYTNLKATFNPVNFEPEKWAKAAKAAGMKYMVFTTKHHDGFCMFDTKQTDYKITDPGCAFSTNPKADVTKEIFNAFRAEGIWPGAYFSKPDWHCEYYWWPYFATQDRNVNYNIEKHPERWEKFVEFTHAQVMELMAYEPELLWFDGGWVQKRTKEQILENPAARLQNQDIRMDELAAKVREKRPGLIVVDRAVHGKNQNYLTPENTVPDVEILDPWESCIISGGGWSYTKDAKYKSAKEIVHILVDIVAKGGNLLLNIAPSPEGTWQADAYDRLEKIGAWMDVNGDAIYATKAIEPYVADNIRFTQKDGVVNAIYCAGEDEASLPESVFIPKSDFKKIFSVSLLGSDSSLKWKKEKDGIRVNIPMADREHPPCHYAWTFQIK